MSAEKKIKSSADGKLHLFKFVRNWVHQAITYMDRGELTIRLLIEGIEIALLYLVLTTLTDLNCWISLISSGLVIHTFNWLTNANFWALYLFAVPDARNPGEKKTIDYLNMMADRLNRYQSITGLALYGSTSRGKWHDASDIDIRMIRKPGLLNLVFASVLTMRERFYAFAHKQPLDLFLADDISFLKRMRVDEEPIFLIKRDPRLEATYPNNGKIKLFSLVGTNTN